MQARSGVSTCRASSFVRIMSPPGRGVLVYEYRHEYARRKHKETFHKTPPMYSLLVNANRRIEPRGERPFQEAKGKLQRIPLRPDSGKALMLGGKTGISYCRNVKNLPFSFPLRGGTHLHWSKIAVRMLRGHPHRWVNRWWGCWAIWSPRWAGVVLTTAPA